MNKRENLLSLLRRQGYSEVPVEFEFCPLLEKRFREETGSTLDYKDYFDFSWDYVDDVKIQNHSVEQYRSFFNPPLKQDGYIDLWGVGHELSPKGNHMTHMRNPLADAETLEELLEFRFPDFQNADASHQKPQVDAIHAKQRAACGCMQMTIWERSWYIRGMENLLTDMLTEPENAEYILDKMTQIATIRATSYASAGVDILFLGDDIGMQRTPLMSVGTYEQWLKPRLAKVISAAKAINPELLVFYHSCGFIEPFIPHLIEAGIDVLNPIQSECMEFENIHRQYGDRISFHGTIGTQSVMPFGTPAQIRENVWRNLDIAGEKGGLYVAPSHMLEPDVPWENVMAYVDACREYRING